MESIPFNAAINLFECMKGEGGGQRKDIGNVIENIICFKPP